MKYGEAKYQSRRVLRKNEASPVSFVLLRNSQRRFNRLHDASRRVRPPIRFASEVLHNKRPKMPLKKIGEKIKSSLHHLSPKSKKTDEVHDEGDLSPCNLPPAAVKQQKDPQPCPVEPKACCDPNAACEGKSPCENPKECQGAEKCADQQRPHDVPTRIEPPAPTATQVEPLCAPSPSPQPCECPCPTQASTPRYEETADIFPTMYYALKTNSKEPLQQSVLLVNPSKSDKARRILSIIE